MNGVQNYGITNYQIGFKSKLGKNILQNLLKNF